MNASSFHNICTSHTDHAHESPWCEQESCTQNKASKEIARKSNKTPQISSLLVWLFDYVKVKKHLKPNTNFFTML